jgi:two-component system OmpR family sensor kinase
MSLRARLLAGSFALLAVLGASGVFVAVRQHRVLIQELDRRLDATAENAWRLTQLARRGGAVPASALGDLYVGVLDGDTLNVLVAPTDDPELSPAVDATLLAQTGRHATVDTTAGNSRRMRILVVDTTDPTLVIGVSSASAERAYRDLLRTIAAAGLAVVIVLAALAYWVLHLGLRPIRDMTDTADAIVSGHADRRAPSFPPGTEAGRLSRAVNTMIDTNQRTEARLRQFVADASHELRTPLTTLRGYVRLYEQGGLRDEGELVDAMGRISREANRMGLLVDDLLLAQLDHTRPIDQRPVDLRPLLDDLAADIRVIQPNRLSCCRPTTTSPSPATRPASPKHSRHSPPTHGATPPTIAPSPSPGTGPPDTCASR